MSDLFTDIQIPPPLTFTPKDTSTVGTIDNLEEYDKFVKPSFTNIVGEGTLENGGYFGRLMSVIRCHLTDMKENQEISKGESGEIYSSLLSHALSESVNFEKSQLVDAMLFSKNLIELERLKLEFKHKDVEYEQAIFNYTRLSQLVELIQKQEVYTANSKRVFTEQQAIIENIKAGGDGTSNPINADESLPTNEINSIKANINLTDIERVLKSMSAGSSTGDVGSHEYTQSLPYLDRLLKETTLGNVGNGVNLAESEGAWNAKLAKANATIQAIIAGGSGTLDDIDYKESTPYISRLVDRSKLGDIGNGINLDKSVGAYQALLSKAEFSLKNIEAGGNGITDTIDYSKSLPYFSRLAEQVKLGSVQENGELNIEESLPYYQAKEAKYRSDLTKYGSIIENIKAGGDGTEGTISHSESLPYYQTVEAKYRGQLTKYSSALEHIRAGGDGNDGVINRDNSKPHYENEIKKYQAIAEKQKAGLNDQGALVENMSTYVNQAKSLLEQSRLYTRQRIAFDERKDQNLLEHALKYNMMVFPDNEEAQDQIPDVAKPTAIATMVETLNNSYTDPLEG